MPEPDLPPPRPVSTNALASLAQPLAIIDLETTGTHALRDRITEIAVIRVDAEGVGEWSTLIQPGVRIPAFVTQLTGISNDTVASAPTFASIAAQLASLLQGRLLVAHHARFDYRFLKAEFERAGIRFQTRTLCSVRLSRALNPEQARHDLDSVIAAYGLDPGQRHRALDDARAVHAFLLKAEERHGAAGLGSAVQRISKRPSLPSYLDESLADDLPECPGVYFFHGEAGMLYVGKAVNIRSRVLSHFASDLNDAKEMRLSQQVRRITWETTAGELGALLTEARYVKTLQPLHNRQLRRQARLVSLSLRPGPAGLLMPVVISGQALSQGQRLYGLFNSTAAVKRILRDLGVAEGLCDYALGLERMAKRPCPSRQLKRCRGWCDGSESTDAHNARLSQALAAHALKTWPFDGMIALEERNSATGEQAFHLVNNWCWLGSANSVDALDALAAAPAEPVLDKDSYRLLLKAILGSNPLPIRLIGKSSAGNPKNLPETS